MILRNIKQIILFHLVCSVYLTTESTKCRTRSYYQLNQVTSKNSKRFILKIDKDKENWPFFHIQYLNTTLMSNSNKSNYFLPGYTNLKSSNNISMETQTGKKEEILSLSKSGTNLQSYVTSIILVMSSWNLAKTENYLKDVDHNIWISNRYVKGVLNITKLLKN